MFSQSQRLTTKDVRYIQKQRNVIRTEHFGVLRIPQYPNRSYHQLSVYIAADTIKKASRRHQIKRQLLEHLQSQILSEQQLGKKYFKMFIFLNKKNVTSWQLGSTKDSRDGFFWLLYKSFVKERNIVNKKLSL